MSENSFWEEEDPVRGAVEQVRESVEKSPGRSSRRRCQELDKTRSTMLRVMRKDLKKFPYRISIHQSLSEVQKISRMVMSKVLMEKIDPRSNGRPILRI